MSQNYTGRVLAILAVLFFALFGLPSCQDVKGIFSISKLFDSSVPLTQRSNLKPGIDIAGGTKLLYEIKVPEGYKQPPGGLTLAESVAVSLKKRVDPFGVRNLVWRPQGDTRLEIQIPRSPNSDKAAEARKALSEATQELESTNVRAAEVTRVIETQSGPQRDQRLAELIAGSAKRKALFDDLTSSWDQRKHATELYEKAKADHKPSLTDQYAADAARAYLKYEDLKKHIEDDNLTVAQLEGDLEISPPADRDKKIDELLKTFSNFPRRVKAIEDYRASYLKAESVKGVIDDAADLKRMLKGSGVLEYHILVEDPQETAKMVDRLQPHGDIPAKGPAPEAGDTSRWYLCDRPDAVSPQYQHVYNGKHYALGWTVPGKQMVHRADAPSWALESASIEQNSNGQRVVGFKFDPTGASLSSQLTGDNLQKPMAIVLDDKIITAPNINSQIGASGIIEGGRKGYTQQELDYLVNTLNAGSLPATLADEPISEQTISPSFGADNLHAAILACLIGLAVVCVFLVTYYYIAGFVAFLAVVMNLIIILGVLAICGATFTLPAIAGIILTVGTAIDANVLVFERLREEEHHGLPLKQALRHAFERARSAIIDSNATTIITSLILYWKGTEEVKGFGLTLLIGICSSLFTALFCTKTLLGILVDRVGVRELGSLPTSFPAWDRFLKPNIDWMKYIWPFVGFSILFIGTGLSAFIVYERQMYDIEFASGTSVQFELKGEGLPLAQVRKMLEPAEKSGAIPSPGVVSINGSEKVYEVVTPNDNSKAVRQALLDTFGDKLNMTLPSRFAMADASLEQAMAGQIPSESATNPAEVAPQATMPASAAALLAATEPATPSAEAGPVVRPIETATINIDGVNLPDVDLHPQGVLVLLRDVTPPLSPNEIHQRIAHAGDLTATSAQQKTRTFDVVRLDGDTSPGWADKPASAVAVLASDPAFPYEKSPEDWKENLARPFWKQVNEGVNREAKLDKVNNFDPQVAGDARRDAIFATIISVLLIMLYIWLRFGNLKYATATVVALLHDTAVVIGAIGLSHYLANTAVGNALLIEPFRINLTLVAAILTVMSYSMIDTIVVFDRIRENRGKYGQVTRKVINDSVNQTLSRTLLTAGNTILMVAVMYICGGPGIHGFTFVLLIGILFGTYSSVAIAAPVLLLGKDKTVPLASRAPVRGNYQRADA